MFCKVYYNNVKVPKLGIFFKHKIKAQHN